MNNTRRLLVPFLLLAIYAPAIAGEEHKCSEDTQTCLNMMASNLKSRGWVGIEMDQDEESGKLTITKVVPESPAMEAGLQERDVLLAMDGIRFSEENKEKMYAARKDMVPGKRISYTIERPGCCHKKGGQSEVTVTLGTLPESVMAEWIGRHMLEHATIEIAQQ